MGGENVKVVENNERLGQVGKRQESKNIDLRIQKEAIYIVSLAQHLDINAGLVHW